MDNFSRIGEVLRYIDEHLDEPLSLEALSKHFYFSPYYFHRLFAAVVGKPLATYIRDRRISIACEQLCSTDKSILDISLASGFRSAQAFSRTFKEVTGTSPSSYRANGHKPKVETVDEMVQYFTDWFKEGISMFGDSEFKKAVRLEYPEVIPTTVSILPAMWIHHGKEIEYLVKQYPQFFGKNYTVDYSDPLQVATGTYKKGRHIDEWGCVWDNVDEGMEAIVTEHPVKDIEDVFSLEIPKNRDSRLPHGFMYLRLLDLCGFENAMVMFAEEGEEIETLINKVLTYNKIQIESIMDRFSEWAVFGDDQGIQTGLAIGAERWRKYLKPCYKEMYGMIKKAHPNTLVYMHTDGCIYDIMPDLQECGVDMINPQYRANGLDNLVRVCRKERIIPINLDLDRQMFPFATKSEIFDHVGECVEALYLPQGGLSLNVELNYEIPMENCAAILEALEKYRHYKK